MKPAFALSLSADGIALIYRAEDGWRSVASTPFDTDDLPAALAAIRSDALRLAPEGIYSKLILPNDQIRYLSIETGGLPAAERIAAARQALAGATPYPVDELAFDICADGSVTHVAAVALETLDEAETFAVEHGFGPVSFVAVPEDGGFQGEPFFGTTRAIRGTEVEPDNTAVKAIGAVQLPDPAPASDVEDQAAAPEAEETLIPAPPSEEAAAPEETSGADEKPDTPKTPPRQEGPETPGDAASVQPVPAAMPAGVPPAPPGVSLDGSAPAPAAAKPDTPENTGLQAQPDVQGSEEKSPAGPLPAAKPGPLVLTDRSPSAAKPGTVKALGPANAVPAEEKAGPARTIPPAPAALRAPSPAAPAPRPQSAPDRKAATGGKRRSFGLALTAALLAAAIAAWALLREDGFLAALMETGSDLSPAPAIISSETASPQRSGATGTAEEIAPQVSVLADQPDPGFADAGLPEASDTDAGPTAEDEAAADGVEPPEEGTGTAFLEPETLQPGAADTPVPPELDELALAARYAATGVWPVAPQLDGIPAAAGLDELYTASVDRTEFAADAVALPDPRSYDQDDVPAAVASPAAAGSAFDLDARGLVKATPEGALNPDGITVYLGRPGKVPPPAPDRSDPAAEALAEEVARNQVLSRKRPKARPSDLAEQVERAQNGGLSRAELASLRPRHRPASLKPAEEDDLPVTAQAIASSVVPRGRPANFANLVDRARRNSQNQVQVAAAVPAAAAATPPRIPTSASVARRATVNNAINLRKLNLIGVYGTAANRRALVRLPSGRYKKVQVGDRIDGGRVIAIGESQLQYQKGGRNRTLTMPKS
ncbi:hypothetical protein K3725_13365 [Leisingera sp. S132]|uniref:hypothetical protein n=1 Tax=Leisingera sp. S132 TaxID=2867016 RepID=UPI0021A39947|nr:hypothetical protein [Leisingera sp. S132]UWQ78299.1 hypothetical protein K3725_13365 [Leisingera sp. S132]